MRGSDLSRPFRGVRVIQADGADSAPVETLPKAEWGSDEWTRHCTALLVALPEHSCFSHLTAARIWPLPLPRSSAEESVHVCVTRPSRPPRRTGVVGHELSDPLARAAVRRGLPVIDPATLFCQLAASLTLADLVAVGDALILEPVVPSSIDDQPWVSLRELTERVERFRGRGKRTAASAVSLVRPGAESRPETLLRLAIRAAGLPEPEVNVDVFDSVGRFIGRGDLVYRQWRVIVEYDGEQHRTDTWQFDRDIRRLEDLAGSGWRVVRLTVRSFFQNRYAAMQRITQALQDGGWRP